jgi:hypothetical protein
MQSGVKFCFVDYGSTPPLPENECIRRVETDYGYEPVAKNHGLLSVDTPLVAFTDWRSLISKRTIEKTLEHLNQEGVPEHMIMQAFPWEMSTYHKHEVLADFAVAAEYGEIIENMAIPHSAPKIPCGAWQVCRTEDAAAIRGWSEDIQIGCAADFHERMRAFCGWANGENRGEILTRVVPVVVADFRSVADTDIEQQLSPQLEKFFSTGDINSLGWSGL